MQDSKVDRRKYSERFIRSLVDFVAVRDVADRTRWKQKYPSPNGMENWEHAMFGQWQALNPLEIHLKTRVYIDEWINTGFFRDDSEIASQRAFRTLSQAPNAIAALKKIVKQLQHEVSFGPKGGITFNPRGISSPTPEALAGEIFLEFYCSDWLFRIMRCNCCKAIVLPKREPRERYVRGWHCDKCRNKAAAQAATDERRKHFKEKWLLLAVDAYREFMSSRRRRTHDVSVFIAARVNESLPYNSRIKRNSITLNLREIQAKADSKDAS